MISLARRRCGNCLNWCQIWRFIGLCRYNLHLPRTAIHCCRHFVWGAPA